MAALERIVVNRDAVSELLKSTVVPLLQGMGNAVAAAAGPGHSVETFIGAERARVTVRTETFAAKRAEAQDRNLSRAIDAARR